MKYIQVQNYQSKLYYFVIYYFVIYFLNRWKIASEAFTYTRLLSNEIRDQLERYGFDIPNNIDNTFSLVNIIFLNIYFNDEFIKFLIFSFWKKK